MTKFLFDENSVRYVLVQQDSFYCDISRFWAKRCYLFLNVHEIINWLSGYGLVSDYFVRILKN